MAAQTRLVAAPAIAGSEKHDPVDPVVARGPITDLGGGGGGPVGGGLAAPPGAPVGGQDAARGESGSGSEWQRGFAGPQSLLALPDSAPALGWTGPVRTRDRGISEELQTQALAIGKSLLASLEDLRRDLTGHKVEGGEWRR